MKHFTRNGGCGGMVSMILIAMFVLGFGAARAAGLDAPITVGMVLWPVLGLACLFGLGAAAFGLLWLLNPFRSGH